MWTQCTFTNEKNRNKHTQGWIETKVAKKGRFVQLLNISEEFWEITSLGNKTDIDPSINYRTWSNNI